MVAGDAVHVGEGTVLETLEVDVVWFLAWFVFYAAVDKVAFRALRYFPDDKNGRYFSLHVICNTYVTVVHLDDVLLTWWDPPRATFQPCDTSGTVAALALHAYHMVFYRPLPVVDWVHHIVMCVIMLPMAYILMPGTLLGHGCFFATGLPGGLDYLMLVLVKLGWMDSLTEKRLNADIQTWLRSPGCVIDGFLVWVAAMEVRKLHDQGQAVPRVDHLPLAMLYPTLFISMFSMFWNGPYFQRRVIVSHTINDLKAKGSLKPKAKQR